MTYPIIQYRLTQTGRIPEEVLAGIETGFSGECAANTNKAGCIPKWIGSQKNQYLGLGIGTESNIQGLPEVVCGVLTTKATLQSYITEISSGWVTLTDVTTGISTYKEVGLATCFDPVNNPSGAGITTTTITPAWSGSAGAGTTVGVTTNTGMVQTSTTDGEGVSTYTRTYTTTTVDEMSNPYDPAAKATELWDIYEAVNGL
tara:strand:- start:84 stop:689 length:606 start_codon:yes stop_codon:yes gene_type:complete